MSLTVFLALCILGLDFLIYVLFHWTYGDRRAALARRIAAQRSALQEPPRPFVVSARAAEPPEPDAAPAPYQRRIA